MTVQASAGPERHRRASKGGSADNNDVTVTAGSPVHRPSTCVHIINEYPEICQVCLKPSFCRITRLMGRILNANI